MSLEKFIQKNQTELYICYYYYYFVFMVNRNEQLKQFSEIKIQKAEGEKRSGKKISKEIEQIICLS